MLQAQPADQRAVKAWVRGRTERVRAWSMARPLMTSPTAGPWGVRARVGLRPKRPQQEAGMRIEPPPSLPWAAGTMPEGTAAAEPPLGPPGGGGGGQGL